MGLLLVLRLLWLVVGEAGKSTRRLKNRRIVLRPRHISLRCVVDCYGRVCQLYQQDHESMRGALIRLFWPTFFVRGEVVLETGLDKGTNWMLKGERCCSRSTYIHSHSSNKNSYLLE